MIDLTTAMGAELINDLFNLQESKEDRIEALMKELQAQVFLEQHEAAAIDAEIRALQEQIDSKMAVRMQIAQPYQKKGDAIRETIREIVLAASRSFKSGYGDVQYRRGYVRRSYKPDALDDLCNSDTILKAKLWPFRTETVVEPGVAINLRF